MTKETKTKPAKVKQVSKEEFDKLSTTVETLAETMTTFVENLSKPKEEEAKDTSNEKNGIIIEDGASPEQPDKMPVPPAWREIVDEVLGKDFGINVVYPVTGSGFLFKILVPLDKSNAGSDYLDFYKIDTRTKSISYSSGIEGVRKYCELVAKNLGIKIK